MAGVTASSLRDFATTAGDSVHLGGYHQKPKRVNPKALPMTTMTSPSPVQTYTPDDLLAMADAVEYELVDGHLVERNVSIESSGVALQIGTLLNIEAKRTGLASVYGPDLGYQSFAKHPQPHSQARRFGRSQRSFEGIAVESRVHADPGGPGGGSRFPQ